MHCYFMFFQISLLCEWTFTDITLKRPWLYMLTVVILDVASLFEDLVTFVVPASKILFIFMWIIVQYFYDVNHVDGNFFQFIFHISTEDTIAEIIRLIVELEILNKLRVLQRISVNFRFLHDIGHHVLV